MSLIKNMIAEKRKEQNLDVDDAKDYALMETAQPDFRMTNKKLNIMAKAIKPALEMEKINEKSVIRENVVNSGGSMSLNETKEIAKMMIMENSDLMAKAYQEVFAEIMKPAVQAMIQNEANKIFESVIGDFAEDLSTITEDINTKYAKIGSAYNTLKKRGLLG